MINYNKIKLIDYPLDKLAMAASTKWNHFKRKSLWYNQHIIKKSKKWAILKTNKRIIKVFKKIGITEDKFKKIITNRELMQKILNKMEAENSKFDIQSTPTFIINDNHKISGYLSYDLKKNLKNLA